MATHAKRKSRNTGKVLVFLMAMLIFGALFVPTAMLLAVGLLPTVAAFVIDNDEKKSTTMSVGLLNAAGVAPFVIRLWAKGQTMQQSTAIIEQPNSWMFMYGAAAIGWLIVYSVPHIIHVILSQRARMRIADIEARHKALRELWGEEVRTAK